MKACWSQDQQGLKYDSEKKEKEINISTKIDTILNFNNLSFQIIIRNATFDIEDNTFYLPHTSNVNSFRLVVNHTFKQLPVVSIVRNQIFTKEYNIKSKSSNVLNVLIEIDTDILNSEIIRDSLVIKNNKIYWNSKGKIPFRKAR